MKNFILFALILASIGYSFSVDTVTPFPTQMYGGGSYAATYGFESNLAGTYYSEVVITGIDGINEAVVHMDGRVCTYSPLSYSCSGQLVNGWNYPKINITFVSNVSPEIRNITVQFSMNQFVPDAPSSGSGGSNNGGGPSSSGYVNRNNTHAQEVAAAEEANKEYLILMNKSQPIYLPVGNMTNVSVAQPLVITPIPRNNTPTETIVPAAASMISESGFPWWYYAVGIGLLVLIIIIIAFWPQKPKPVVEGVVSG
jgi:hypothetical protein